LRIAGTVAGALPDGGSPAPRRPLVGRIVV